MQGLKGKSDYIKGDGKVKWGLLSLNIPGKTGIKYG